MKKCLLFVITLILTVIMALSCERQKQDEEFIEQVDHFIELYSSGK